MKLKLLNIYLSVSKKLYKLISQLNGKKKQGKILIFTDSRGTEISSLKQKNPFFSYIDQFSHFEVDFYFCPSKFTSCLDYLELMEKLNIKYDHVILHCGIVDFAPRPMSSYKEMLLLKTEYINRNGWQNYFNERDDFLCDYEGERSLQFMSNSFVKEVLTPRLSDDKRIIYVGVNRILNNWDGNYWRKRPSCINLQLINNEKLLSALEYVVDLSDWDDETIKKYTVDNVHYNKLGLEFIGKSILDVISRKSR